MSFGDAFDANYEAMRQMVNDYANRRPQPFPRAHWPVVSQFESGRR